MWHIFPHGGCHKWGVPPELMVYNGQSDEYGWELGVTPF
jgi:hypothetical protein